MPTRSLDICILLATISLVTLPLSPASAFTPEYTCVDVHSHIPSITEKLGKYDAIFTGEFIATEEISDRNGDKRTFAKVKLEQYWKGFDQTDQYALVTEYYTATKSQLADVSAGDKILVYANATREHEARVYGTAPECDGSKNLNRAIDDLRTLGPGIIAAGRMDVPASYLRQDQFSFTLDNNDYAISTVSVDTILDSGTVEPEGITTLFFQNGAEGIVEVSLPSVLLDGFYTVTSEDDEVASELHFAEVSSVNSTTTLQVSLPSDTESIEILGRQAMISAGKAILLLGMSTTNLYEAEITWRLSEGYRQAAFYVEIFDAMRPEKEGPIDAHYDIFMYRDKVQLLSLDEWRMTENSVLSKELSIRMQDGDHQISIENINGTDEKIEIPLQVTPEFPIMLAGLIVATMATGGVIAFNKMKLKTLDCR